MDGTSTNFSCMKRFGCNLDGKGGVYDGSFLYVGYDHKIYFIPDPSHMLKLARNALHDYEVFVDADGNEIHWKAIRALYDLQEEELDGIKLGNKLSSRHIFFQRQKMKVKYAAQTLSSSVAAALETLRKDDDPSFRGTEGTIKFIRVVDRLFDLLNSRNKYE